MQADGEIRLGDDFNLHVVEYGYEGQRWLLFVAARDPEDAMGRLAAASEWGEVVGNNAQLAPTVPGVRWWVRLLTWWRNCVGRG